MANAIVSGQREKVPGIKKYVGIAVLRLYPSKCHYDDQQDRNRLKRDPGGHQLDTMLLVTFTAHGHGYNPESKYS